MSKDAVPRLDLAPQRTRPLALWNPWDYLVLLYWVFFFPQAIRWYVETFADPQFRDSTGREIFKVLRDDRILFQLVLQAVFTTVITAIAVMTAPLAADVRIDPYGVAGGVAVGFVVGIAFGVSVGVAEGVAVSIAAGIAFGIAFGFAGLHAAESSFVESVAVGVAVGAAVGVAGSVGFGIAGGVDVGAVEELAVGLAGGIIGGGIICFPLGAGGGFAFGASLVLTFARIPDWCLVRIFVPWSCRRPWSRMVWLPLAAVRRQLEERLTRNWEAGALNLNQYLSLSAQFISVVSAVNNILAGSSKEDILRRITTLADGPYDWKLVYFCSANLKDAMSRRFIAGIFVLPRRYQDIWKARYPKELRFDTPARSACAGFWLWHRQNAIAAVEAFEGIRELPHGEELCRIAQAFADGEVVDSLESLAALAESLVWLNSLTGSELRPRTLQALGDLDAVSREAVTAHHARSDLNRSAALGRASNKLRELIETGHEFCPEPEWPLVRRVAEGWQDIIIRSAGEAGKAVLREPIDNPYAGYSGLPVVGPAFKGRRDVLRQIETCWTTTEALVPIFLFGHRRMGKTSILRNLEDALGASTHLAYLDMQDAAWVDHTGQLLLDLAEAIHEKAIASDLDAGAPPDKDRFASLGQGRRELNALLKRLDPQMDERRLIVAIDEFEVIEDGIEDKRIDAGVIQYLRSINQRHRWLGLILGGLHTLEEMGHDYRSAFWGQAEHVRVSYLTKEATVDLVARPDPDFALEYADDLLDELYRLTYGQPYLLQRLCWELVNRWNERFLKDGEKTPRVLELAELEPVLDADFYRGADYYFDGVWSNVTEAEQTALAALAERDGPWRRDEVPADDDVLGLLLRHDVVVEEGGDVRFGSELMRRWVSRRP